MISPQDVVEPWNRAELLEAIALDQQRLAVEKRSAVIASGIFLLFASMVVVFSDVGPFHAFWTPLGLISLAGALITMLYALYAVFRLQGAFSFLRELGKELADLDQRRDE